jgi:uncharacterized protein YacL
MDNPTRGTDSVTDKVWRLFFTLLLTVTFAVLWWYAADAYLNSPLYSRFTPPGWLEPVERVVFTTVGVIFGLWIGALVFRRIEMVGETLRAMSVRDKLAIGIGLVIGLLLTVSISVPILFTIPSKLLGIAIMLLIGIALTYLCIIATLSMKEEVRFYMPPPPEGEEDPPKEKFKILDTNVIIDGRVADVAKAGFVEGPIYIPGFVLDELQRIADSADGLKRARGRRGLDILNNMQKELTLVVRSYDRLAPPGADEVDARLVRLAKALGGAIVTNDWNLNKVAELQGIQVLNINELANALKPVVLPGEEMSVTIVKEGKEASQGVGYLDDGTMIVVEGGRRYVGETVDVLVSSVLQTQAGKMIFAHLQGEHDEENDVDRSVRAYTSRRPRRPVR